MLTPLKQLLEAAQAEKITAQLLAIAVALAAAAAARMVKLLVQVTRQRLLMALPLKEGMAALLQQGP